MERKRCYRKCCKSCRSVSLSTVCSRKRRRLIGHSMDCLIDFTRGVLWLGWCHSSLDEREWEKWSITYDSGKEGRTVAKLERKKRGTRWRMERSTHQMIKNIPGYSRVALQQKWERKAIPRAPLPKRPHDLQAFPLHRTRNTRDLYFRWCIHISLLNVTTLRFINS